MEQVITINGITEGDTKTGRKYWKCETDEGNISCFEVKVAEALKANIGKKIKVEIKETDDGAFRNIKEFKGLFIVPVEQPQAVSKEAIDSKNKGVYTSYAKDMFIAMYPDYKDKNIADMMDACVELVKQARDQF